MCSFKKCMYDTRATTFSLQKKPAQLNNIAISSNPCSKQPIVRDQKAKTDKLLTMGLKNFNNRMSL